MTILLQECLMLAKRDGLHSLLLTTRIIEVTFLGKSCGGSIVAVISVIGVISLSFYRISRTHGMRNEITASEQRNRE